MSWLRRKRAFRVFVGALSSVLLLITFAKVIYSYTSGDTEWGNETGIVKFPESNTKAQIETLLTETNAEGIGPAKINNAVAVRFMAPDSATINRVKLYTSDSITNAEPSWRVYLASGNVDEDEPISFQFATGF